MASCHLAQPTFLCSDLASCMLLHSHPLQPSWTHYYDYGAKSLCYTRPLTLLSMVTTEQKTNSFTLKLEPTGYIPGGPVVKTPDFDCGEAQVRSLVWELISCMPQGRAPTSPTTKKIKAHLMVLWLSWWVRR